MLNGDITTEYLTAAYVCVSVLVFMLICLLVYVTCSRKFRLNWYEKTQLESACLEEQGELSNSVSGGGYGDIPAKDNSASGRQSNSNLSRFLRSQSSSARLDSPSTTTKEFWVPVSIQRQASFCQSDGPNEFSGDDSAPDTPNTPLGIKVSPFALSHMSQPDRGLSPLVKSVQPSPQLAMPRKIITMYGKLDHTKIDATLYQEEKENEVEMQEDGPAGLLNLSASYNPQFSLLCVHLMKAQNLVSKDVSGSADPYIKVRLLPELDTWRESSVQWNTLNPTFDEEVVFDLPESELKDKILELLLFDFDQNSRHQCLGRAEVVLAQLNLQETVILWKGIHFSDQKDDKPDIGDLMFSVGYLQSAERLTVVVLQARNLKAVDENKCTSDPYVKVAIFNNSKRLKKKKTNVQKSTTNPVFNEALSFNNVNKDLLKTLILEISVMNENLLGQNEVLGTVIVGPNSKGEEALHRRSVLSGRSAVAMWHALTTNTGGGNTGKSGNTPQAID